MISDMELCHTMNGQVDALIYESSIIAFSGAEEGLGPLCWRGEAEGSG